jgi:tRNA(Ile)-lysidine synthase
VDDCRQCLEKNIASHRLMPEGARALVAVSGGVDSMVLLHLLSQTSGLHRWKLVVAHFNHQLRGRAADADERFVARAAKKLGWPFESERCDVAERARAEKLSVEMAARKCRHDFLARTARRLGLRRIFLAHHADDQVELFFVRLLRGAGTQGLGGMERSAPASISNGVALLRPLLEESKANLAAYAQAHRIAFREDATNRSTDILRNRIRHELLPKLREYQPAIDRAVLRSMKLIHDEGEFVTLEAIAWLQKRRRGRFDSQPIALQRRVIQIELIGHGIVPQFEHVEALRERPNEWLTLRPLVACRRTSKGDIELRPVTNVHFPATETVLELGIRAGRAAFESATFQWSFHRDHKLPPARPGTEFFDADAVGPTITLRHWRAGDRFQPIGLPRAVKLQDFFVNQKMPRERRHEVLLATTADGEIFWVEDARIGERFKVTAATKRILRWNWHPEERKRR